MDASSIDDMRDDLFGDTERPGSRELGASARGAPRRRLPTLRAAGLSTLLLVVLAASLTPTHAFAAATSGPGRIVLTSGSTVVADTSGQAVRLRYTAPGTGLSDGVVTVGVPRGWTRPQNLSAARPGYVTVNSGLLNVARRKIRVSSIRLCGGCSFTISYTNAKAPKTGRMSRFLTKSAPSSTTRLRALAVQPVISVGASGSPPPPPGPPPPPPLGVLASDSFQRVVKNGWGSANVGGAYVIEKGNAADFSVDGIGGLFAIRDAVYTSAEHIVALPAASTLDAEATFDVSFLDNVKALHPVFGGVLAGVIFRFHNANDTGSGYYRLQLVWNANSGHPDLWLRAQDDSGKSPPGHFKVEQNLGIDPTADYPNGGPYTYHVKVQITRVNVTSVALKAWKPGSSEPANWQLTGTDTGNFGPQGAGPVGVRASADLQSSSASFLPVTSHIRVANLVVNRLN